MRRLTAPEVMFYLMSPCASTRERSSAIHLQKGEWGKEERKSNPYKKGDDIDIRIRAHDSKYQIFVNQTGNFNCGLAGIGLAFGSTLLFNGMSEKKGKRFHINLLKKNGDIALHFNPRFDEKAVVRNSLIAGEWGNEEREGKIPFENGVGFDGGIKNEEYAFQIFVNSKRYATYAHRLDPYEPHGLPIGGGVQITGNQMC
ncbi:hypothetical protein KIN20_015199 [Parelaphostrongylus tenuis]|uniref:Galectin n=1 Tax=Parelaphostrongylus tenuis TaxID=148309 RepID=A0AAD5MJ64_PARTN|nr:hypothetical protein KIN20_015199 [Parelaphostrongylus tenuis]